MFFLVAYGTIVSSAEEYTMKTKKKFSCLPGFIAAGAVGCLGLIPTYFYVRMVPVLVAAVMVLYCLLAVLAKKRPRLARVCRWVLTVILILGILVCSVTGIMILRSSRGAGAVSCPYIVVLGAKVEASGPSPSLQERIEAAHEYLTAHPDTIAIVSGGQGSDEPITEAQCMYECLVAMGIEPQRILKEEQATSTWGNLSFSLDIIEDLTGSRPDTVGVVSSEFHLFRTALQAKEQGLEILGIPAHTGSFDRWLHYFLREICGVWHYILLGGQNQ